MDKISLDTQTRRIFEGRLEIVLRRPGCAPCQVRKARNTVMRTGAELVAGLFRGEVTTPISGVAVGLDPTPASPPYAVASLTTTAPDGTPLLQNPAVALQADATRVEVLTDEFKIRVVVRSVIPDTHANSTNPDDAQILIGEAALGVLAETGDSLTQIYNRVVFEPIPKTPDHELALYWEVDFPYGP